MGGVLTLTSCTHVFLPFILHKSGYGMSPDPSLACSGIGLARETRGRLHLNVINYYYYYTIAYRITVTIILHIRIIIIYIIIILILLLQCHQLLLLCDFSIDI